VSAAYIVLLSSSSSRSKFRMSYSLFSGRDLMPSGLSSEGENVLSVHCLRCPPLYAWRVHPASA